VSPVRYELGFYIPEDGVLHSRRQSKPEILHSNWEVPKEKKKLNRTLK
jgi:hypothetical protein